MSNCEDVYCEDMFYSNGYPAFCPLTKSQCKHSCQFLTRSKIAGYWTCLFGSGKVLQRKDTIRHPYSDREIAKIKERWSN